MVVVGFVEILKGWFGGEDSYRAKSWVGTWGAIAVWCAGGKGAQPWLRYLISN